MQSKRGLRAALQGLLGISALLLAAAAAALTPETARFRSVGLADGLSQPSVKAMVQDRDGLLWFGTQVGLNRYDGSELRVFYHQPDDPASLSHNNITALASDADGGLWVGTDGGGLNRFDAARERFRVYRQTPDASGLPDDTVNALLAGADGQLWVGTEGGLSRWEPAQQAFVATAPAPDVRIRALAWAGADSLWIGTPAGLLHYRIDADRWEPAALPAEHADFARQPVRALLASADGSVWIGGEAGLLWWHPARGEVRRWRHDPVQAEGLGNDVIGALLRDRDGRLWIGHEAGVDALVEGADGARFIPFRHQRQAAQGLGSGRIASLLQDRAGGLWFGTWSAGASLLNPYARRVLSFGPDIPATAELHEPEVPALAAQEPSTLWLGGRGGLFAFDVETRRLTAYPALRGERIYGVVVLDDGLLLGSERGLLHFSPATGALREAPDEASRTMQINLLQRDGERLWVGTREPSLLLLDLRSLQVLQRFPADGLLRFVAPFDAGRMLVGTAHGLFWHDRQSGEPLFRHAAEPGRAGALASSILSSFLRSRDGELWLATNSGGLHRMQLDSADPASARFEVFSRGQGPVADTVSALLEDAHGRLWMSSSRGIVRFDPQTRRFTTYLTADGSFASGYYANVRAQFASGVMAFAGPDGFTLVDPRAASEMPPPPAPLLLDLLLDNRVVRPGSLELPVALARQPVLELPATRARSVGLRFAAPDTLAAGQLHYAYRLDGFDPDWIETDGRARQATYTNLAPGDYRFRVVAINQDGQRSPSEAVLDLRLLPPWWQTTWAKLLGLLGLALLVYAAHAWRVRRLDRQQERLQREVAERTAELTDSNRALNRALDDLRRTQRSLVEQEKMASLGALVAGVAHEINTPVGVALTSASHLNEVTHAAIGKLAAGKLTQSDFLSFRDAVGEGMRLIMGSLDRAHTLVASFKQVAVDQSSEQRRRIELRGFLDEVRLSLQPSYRQSAHRFELACSDSVELDTYPGALFQILGNLVNNSLLHGFADGRAGLMRLEVRREGQQVVFDYRDDGVGMPPEIAARAFEPFFTTRRGSGGSGLGLHIVYNLVTQLLGGEIALQPEERGLHVRIRIPLVAPRRVAAAS